MPQAKHFTKALLLVVLFAIAVGVIKFFLTKEGNNAEQSATTTTVQDEMGNQIDGKSIYQKSCAHCHAFRKLLTAPPMTNVEKRGPWRDRRKLFDFVRNPGATILKYTYTKKLAKEYNGQIMPGFLLSDKEMIALFDYIAKASVEVQPPLAAN
jgi:cytochrome c5